MFPYRFKRSLAGFLDVLSLNHDIVYSCVIVFHCNPPSNNFLFTSNALYQSVKCHYTQSVKSDSWA